MVTVKDDCFYSKALEREKKIKVILPPNYENERQKYPVLYLLHGYGGNRSSWLINTNILDLIAGYNLIVVIPESGRRWFVNDYEGYLYEDYLVNELVPYIDQHYDTFADGNFRAIAGFSMGGAAAVMQLFRHSEVFKVAASHSGAFGATNRIGDPYEKFRNDSTMIIPTTESHERVWGPPGSLIRKSYDVYAMVAKFSHDQKINIYFDVGVNDYERVIKMNRDFYEVLKNNNISCSYYERPGGHDWNYVKVALPYSLEFISRFCHGQGK